MGVNNMCNCRNNCTSIAVVVSIIIGIITAFLRITGVITATPAFLWVVFGIAVVYLAVVLTTTAILVQLFLQLLILFTPITIYDILDFKVK